MATRIQLRRDTYQNWLDNDPVLYDGELGFEKDTLKIKIGVGTNWSLTSYATVTPQDLLDALSNAADVLYIAYEEKGAAGGVATLDGIQNVPTSQLSGSLASFGLTTNNLESVITGIESQTTIDSAPTSDWKTLKYLIQMTYSGEIHSLEVLVANDGTNILVSEYGDLFTSVALGSVSVESVAGSIDLKINPTSGKTPLAVRFFRTGIKA